MVDPSGNLSMIPCMHPMKHFLKIALTKNTTRTPNKKNTVVSDFLSDKKLANY